MNRNGYAPSIMDTAFGEDYILKIEMPTARHEIFFGTSNRRLSKKYGLWVNVCPQIHNKIHADRETDLKLKKQGQSKFEETHSREEFMALFGRNWL